MSAEKFSMVKDILHAALHFVLFVLFSVINIPFYTFFYVVSLPSSECNKTKNYFDVFKRFIF